MGLVRRALAFAVDAMMAGALGVGGVACAWFLTGTDPWRAVADPAAQVYLVGVWAVALGAYLLVLRGNTAGRSLLRRKQPAAAGAEGRWHHHPHGQVSVTQGRTEGANPLVRQVAAQLAVLSAAEMDSVRRFVEGREQLTAEARAGLARRLADGLRAKLPVLSPADCPDDGVLVDVVYAALKVQGDAMRVDRETAQQ